MNGPRKVLQVLVAIFAFTSFGFCSASAFYITRDGAGSKNGSSLANAAACDATPGVAQGTCAAFNNSANWGSGSTQIGPGTVVHLGGDGVAITASSGASGYMTFQGSGSSGNVIELLFDAGFSPAGLNSPYWCCSLSGGAINLGGNSYILIDGGANTPCGWNTATNASEGTCNGSIQGTANGDGLKTEGETTGIFSSSCNNVEIRNLGIYNLYVKSNPAVGPVSNSISIFVDGGAASNCLIHDNDIHDNYQLIQVAPSNNSGTISIYRNEMYNMNQGLLNYSNASITIGTFNIYGNHIHDMALWDVNIIGAYHHDGVYLTYPNGAQTISSLNVYGNIWDGQAQGVNGGPTQQSCATSWFYMDGGDNVTAGYFYNNVVMSTTGCTTTGGGDPMINWGINSGTVYVYNNTFVCGGNNYPPGGMEIDQHSGTTRANFFNNLFVYCNRFINLTASPDTYDPATTGWDYNVYTNANSGNEWSPQNGCCVATLSAWQSAIGQDAHAQYTSGSANLGGSYENGAQSPLSGIIPQSNSMAKGAGLNLTSLGIAALNSDITGAARPSTGTWDAGAVQYGSGSGVLVPSPPTGLSAVVQ
ncbi:MAG: hypothetical protein WBW31_24680 [Candidatus Sulfotelmatobacter sp.]